MDGVGDTAGLEKIFLSVKDAWEREWKEYRINLATLIGERFQEEDLRTLCFHLNIDYDDLPAKGNKNKARELVASFERQGKLDELVQEGKKMLPKVSWVEPPVVMSEPWRRVNWGEAARRYAAFIQRECGTMRVLGQSEPVSLEGIFTDVYMLDRPTAHRRYRIEELQKEYRAREWPEHRAERKGGIEAVQKNGRLFILGKPGAGKTTFLKYMALQAAKGKLDKFPIFISLKALVDSKRTLFDYVISQFLVCSLPSAQPVVERLLQSGYALILLDGLDEINQADDGQRQMAGAIEQFGRDYSNNQLLMTCRIAATNYNFADFTYIEMADFTLTQVQIFVGKWFASDEKKRNAFLAELEKPESEGLLELARTPLLLALLCLAFNETMAFPQRRVEIYEEAIDALLKKWDSSRNILREEIYRNLSLGRKRQMLARIATETFEKGIYFIPQRTLEKMIVEYLRHIPPGRPVEEVDAEAVLKAIEAHHGMLIERARGIYSFAHLTFQEYFTAKHIVDNTGQRTLERLLEEHLKERHWREIFLLTASLLDNADGFFRDWLVVLANLATAEPFLAALIGSARALAIKRRQAANSTPIGWRIAYLFFALSLQRAFDPTIDHALTLTLKGALNRAEALENALALDLSLDRAFTHALARDLDLGIALSRNRALDRDRIIDYARTLGHDLGLTMNLDYVLPHDPALALELDHIIALARAINQDPNPTADYPRAIDLTRTINRVLNSDFGRNQARVSQIIQTAAVAAQTLGLHELKSGLTELVVPAEKEITAKWKKFTEELHEVIRKHMPWQGRSLSNNQLEQITTYLEVNRLLLECLDLAYVSDREGIKNRMLLLPGDD